MNPKMVSATLSEIADKLDRSKNPSRSMVAAELTKVLTALESPMQQTALPQSNTGKSMLKKLLDDAEKALESGDEGAFKKALESLTKNA